MLVATSFGSQSLRRSRGGGRGVVVVSAVVAVLAGAILAVQVRVNGALGAALGDALVASAISFAVGLLGAAAVVVGSRKARRGFRLLHHAIATRRVRWWELLGGLSGVLYIFSQGLTGASLGAALFTVGVVAGQTLSSLIVDRLGWGPAGPITMTPTRLIAAALGLAAGLQAVVGGLAFADNLLLLAFPFAAGLSLAWQQAVNSTVAVVSEEPLGITLINFALGAVLLAPAVLLLPSSRQALSGAWPSEVWIYSGGLFGVAFVVLATVIVARSGVLVFGLASIGGQLAVSVALDLLFPTGRPFQWTYLLAVVTAFSAAAIALPWRQRTRSST
ncbi:DMT family transporter [Klugiella sp. YN-L-19]|uniref:DMT family transporter n=2 Tax=Ruicaihuangia caeni TaxID=3042517 RepID=A0AAW6T1U2_9MICO|nr:DMT family transporter [Klugiella sp. YN-L-19]MDI2097379.1 DMT family transporter [Klugiella sp. YN-L-19]